MNKYKVNTELLICAIEEKKCIWDVSTEDYKNRDMKSKSFIDVAAVVVQNFEDLNEKEKEESVSIVQKRWKTARDAFVRDRAKLKKLKSGESAKKMKKYIYYENLKFLEKTMDLNMTDNNLEQEEKVNHGDALSGSENECDGVGDDDGITIKNSKEIENFPRRKKKKVDALESKVIEFLDNTSNSENDSDGHKAFLTSLLPTLKTCNGVETLQFRSEVLKIIMEMKKIPPRLFNVSTAVSSGSGTYSTTYQQYNENADFSRPSTSHTNYYYSPEYTSTSSISNERPNLMDLSGLNTNE